MAPSIRKAMGVVKDQTSIGLAKVTSNMAPELEVAIVKATSHDDDPANSYLDVLLKGLDTCISGVSKRLVKTRDWIVALNALMLVHRLMSDGDPILQHGILFATRRGIRLLNMSGFKDEAHTTSWDHSAFVRAYSLYLDQRLELMLFESKLGGAKEDESRSPPSRYDYEFGDGSMYGRPDTRRSRSFGDVGESSGRGEENKSFTPLRNMKPERIFAKMGHLQMLLDRFLACRPTGLAMNNRMILIALYPLLKDSFNLYTDTCEVLAMLVDKFFEMEWSDCVKAFKAYASAAKQIHELVVFYNWCKDTGVARSSEFPEVQRITDELLETLEEFVSDRSKIPKSPERKKETSAPLTKEEEEPIQDMNEIKALPAPESFTSPPPVEPEHDPQSQARAIGDLVDLRDDTGTDDQGNKMALALFAGSPNNENGSWERFSANSEPEMTSAWQTPAAEPGKADWELALVESASNLAKQKAFLGGGFDPLLLNGMYDQGIVRQHTSSTRLTGGSASSVALPAPGKTTTAVLALPGPDGSIQSVGQDPFAVSLSIPPPAYVQMAEMEKKQHFLTQEQLIWQQYARDGMRGQAMLAKISGSGYYAPGVAAPMMPYGMPPMNGMMPSNGYYYAPL
ncbi:hypothetical protein V2J09_022311 [Rumex salicifolius]